jgi:hypothetical protein
VRQRLSNPWVWLAYTAAAVPLNLLLIVAFPLQFSLPLCAVGDLAAWSLARLTVEETTKRLR